MPSPFPGMDPYLEAREVWPDVHQRLITYISEALQPQLRPKYVARIGERIQLAQFGGSYVPDVLVRKTIKEAAPAYTTADRVDEPQRATLLDDAYREPYIEIITSKTGEVITLIELLSPANKEGKGREQYLPKQDQLLATPVNLVEIDLLGYGTDTALARSIAIEGPADWRYLINVSRAKQRSSLEYYAVPLRDRLPRFGIPLRPPDADAVLDLPAVFTRSYDIGSYDLLVDYTQGPAIPLRQTEAEWLDQWLRQKGIRTENEKSD
ncbi:MAG: DUF4058 family protein [Ardenticatenaceae bacterium]|nr:DUF4058 family protein [Ardenticatenaceae bacterium]